MAIPVILDTDIGTDVDDCLALGVLLASPEVELIGVTAVYGDVMLRSRMLLKLLRLRGGDQPPVAAGASEPLLPQGPVYWEGHEGQGLLTAGDLKLQPAPIHAADFLVQTVRERPGEIYLVAIGPLTNLALALLKEPRMAADLAGITVMGGAVGGRGALDLPWVEHNFRCDPAAARIVLGSGVRVRIVPLDVTTKVRIEAADVARIRAVGSPFHLAIAEQIERYPRYQARSWTYLHDPLAAATLVRPDLVEWTPVHVAVETAGDYSAGKLVAWAPGGGRPPNGQIALDVNARAAHDFIVERLLA